MPCYLIRHGKKSWENGASYIRGSSHDPPLVDGEDVLELRETLGKLSKPDLIICSPFLRCQQTAALLSNGQIPIVVDPDLREYLGNWAGRKKVVIEETTRKYIPPDYPLIEKFPEFKERVLKTIEKGYYTQNVWIVTHGLVIRILIDKLRNLQMEIPEAGYIEI